MPRFLRPYCTVMEAPSFVAAAAKIFTEQELIDLFDVLSTTPEAGVLISGSGGIRKFRWGRGQTGKRGGARVVYFYRQRDMVILLLGAYAKNQKSDLTASEAATFRKIVEEFCSE
jgi:hypothetical protein